MHDGWQHAHGGSPLCSSIATSSTTTLKAIATASAYNPSAIASGIYTNDPGATAINYGAGFTATGIIPNGSVEPNDTGDGQVRLSWNASSGATSYNVKRSTTNGGPYTRIASPTTTSYTDTGVDERDNVLLRGVGGELGGGECELQPGECDP